MKAFGNLMNRVQEDVKSATPEVGMGATMLGYSDRHAATVVEVLSPKKIAIQQDTAKRTDKNGMSESQEYEYSPNPNGSRITVTLRKDGRWRIEKDTMVVSIGHRDEYYDFSF